MCLNLRQSFCENSRQLFAKSSTFDAELLTTVAKNVVTDAWQGPKCDVLHDLVPFAQFKNSEKRPWRSDNFCKVSG